MLVYYSLSVVNVTKSLLELSVIYSICALSRSFFFLKQSKQLLGQGKVRTALGTLGVELIEVKNLIQEYIYYMNINVRIRLRKC